MYTGVSPETVGAGGLNSLALGYFDVASMAGACAVSATSAPCLAPVAAGGGSSSLAFVQSTVAATQAQLAANIAAGGRGGAPLYLLSFGGAAQGGAAWDALLGNAAAAAAFGANAAAVVSALAAAFPGAAFGVDLNVQGTSSALPQLRASSLQGGATAPLASAARVVKPSTAPPGTSSEGVRAPQWVAAPLGRMRPR
jgi:hypothetical protein